MNALIIAEHDNNTLSGATMSAIGAAQQLATTITILIVGYNCKAILSKVSLLHNVDKILYIDNINYRILYAEQVAAVVIYAIQQDIKYYEYIITTGTLFGQEVMPRIAACLDVEQISEIIKIINNNTFARFIYSGDAVEVVQLCSNLKCLTIRPGYFVDSEASSKNNNNNHQLVSITRINAIAQFNLGIIQQRKLLNVIKNNVLINLSNAKIVVAGGRALQSKENFGLIEQLAKKLNAAVGATRTAVYAGFAPYEWQIGLSGKIIAPDLYIAIGISGAVQHICGIKDSKVIIAINIDREAPICKIATYKIIGDLFKIVPELIDCL